ncbi:hypothetical protein COY26_03435 [Candidatus Woesearchaeota archaeon CG_4_10_14_0_2_um_filter_33_10]|nr:MAG: hypothetical protein AUJ83_04305 [Candidatus Woesearchaeota archaeon CG1_02_33_12]PIZ52868.1 MAG: hypothetical protein COY26_03435 [Candidatus Woesearchaeota archaeon CG_4_10_14_0_2_um_filter_33_10]
MDNLDDNLKITRSTEIGEVIDYAIRVYEKHTLNDLTKERIREYAINVFEHSNNVHSYLDKLGISIKNFKEQYEIETPHDLAGEGNKLEWEVMRGFIYTEKEKENDSKKKGIFEEALKRHRIQMHHQMWNDDKSPDEWLKYGAIDAVCSLLEDRRHQGGSHTWKEIQDIINYEQRSEHQTYWMNWAVEEMKKVTPLLKNLEIWISSLLQGNNKSSEEKNNSSN